MQVGLRQQKEHFRQELDLKLTELRQQETESRRELSLQSSLSFDRRTATTFSRWPSSLLLAY